MPSHEELDAPLYGEVIYNLPISWPLGTQFTQLKLDVESTSDLNWMLYQDGNGDNILDSSDPLWNVTAAKATIPRHPDVGWSDRSVFRASLITEDGNVHSASSSKVLRATDSSSGVIETQRFMALDRDCDGFLADERSQDAIFEPFKQVTDGECIVMRINFRNTGDTSANDIVLKDMIPPQTIYKGGSARFETTPLGLIGKTVILPNQEDNENEPYINNKSKQSDQQLEWSFIGALAPGLHGRVEYMVQINEK